MNLVTIFGARPRFIKAGPGSAALAASGIHERPRLPLRPALYVEADAIHRRAADPASLKSA